VLAEAVLSAQNSVKPLESTATRNPAGGAHSASQTSQWVGRGLTALIPFPNPTPLSAFGLDFRPFGPHLAASPTVFIPPMLRVLDKTLVFSLNGEWMYSPLVINNIFFWNIPKAPKALNFVELSNLFASSKERSSRIFHQKSVDDFLSIILPVAAGREGEGGRPDGTL